MTTQHRSPSSSAPIPAVAAISGLIPSGPRGQGEALSNPPCEKLLQVGDLAAASGKTVRAIHLYEELGLLHPDARSKGRFRLYDPQAVTRVRWIGKLHDLGMSLTQIREVVSEWEGAPSAGRAMSKIRTVYSARLEETRAQIARLQDLEHELSASISYLDTCETCDSSLIGEPIPDYATSTGRRLPQVTEHSHAHHGEGAPEVGSCVSCEMRERDLEPELVAGIHHYSPVDSALAGSHKSAPQSSITIPAAKASSRGRAKAHSTVR